MVTELGNPLQKRAFMTFHVKKFFGENFWTYFFSVSATVHGFEIGVRYEKKKRKEVELTLLTSGYSAIPKGRK